MELKKAYERKLYLYSSDNFLIHLVRSHIKCQETMTSQKSAKVPGAPGSTGQFSGSAVNLTVCITLTVTIVILTFLSWLEILWNTKLFTVRLLRTGTIYSKILKV